MTSTRRPGAGHHLLDGDEVVGQEVAADPAGEDLAGARAAAAAEQLVERVGHGSGCRAPRFDGQAGAGITSARATPRWRSAPCSLASGRFAREARGQRARRRGARR